MRMPFMAVVLAVLTGTVALRGQSASSPMQLVHPILKDPNKRLAPTSLDRDPSLLQDPGSSPSPNPSSSRPATLPAGQPAQPAVIVAKIDTGLSASKLNMIATINGIKGTIYVTNVGMQEITPVVQVAVCDPNGFKVGTASKTGDVLAPNAGERIVLVGTNANAADLKLMRLTFVGAK